MRVATPAEKVLAFSGIYRALFTELDGRVDPDDAGIQVALIDVALTIAMSTDTRDMGIMTIPGTSITRVVERREIDEATGAMADAKH